jgi:pantothenate kinase
LTVATSLEQLRARIDMLAASGRRRIIGLTGAPGCGKSTLAEHLFAHAPERSVIVPMDGYHLANVELARLARAGRKGAEDTFDSAGYVALLRRLRAAPADEIVYAPEFRREIEEPIAGAIPVFPATPLVITEGNYLLLDRGHWTAVRALLDEVWYIDVNPEVRMRRLVARHVRFGRAEAQARAWVASTDEPNAVLIAATQVRADLIVRLEPD